MAIKRMIYQEIAGLIDAAQRCAKTNNGEWQEKHEARLKEIAENYLPSGSGIDNGADIDIDASAPDRLVINTAFHHMNENGYYNGWTEHKVIVTPSLQFEFNLKITGRNRNDIKDYLYDIFADALREWITIGAPDIDAAIPTDIKDAAPVGEAQHGA